MKGRPENQKDSFEICEKVNLRFDCSGLLPFYIHTRGYLKDSSKTSLRFGAESKATEMDNVLKQKSFKKKKVGIFSCHDCIVRILYCSPSNRPEPLLAFSEVTHSLLPHSV